MGSQDGVGISIVLAGPWLRGQTEEGGEGSECLSHLLPGCPVGETEAQGTTGVIQTFPNLGRH